MRNENDNELYNGAGVKLFDSNDVGVQFDTTNFVEENEQKPNIPPETTQNGSHEDIDNVDQFQEQQVDAEAWRSIADDIRALSAKRKAKANNSLNIKKTWQSTMKLWQISNCSISNSKFFLRIILGYEHLFSTFSGNQMGITEQNLNDLYLDKSSILAQHYTPLYSINARSVLSLDPPFEIWSDRKFNFSDVDIDRLCIWFEYWQFNPYKPNTFFGYKLMKLSSIINLSLFFTVLIPLKNSYNVVLNCILMFDEISRFTIHLSRMTIKFADKLVNNSDAGTCK